MWAMTDAPAVAFSLLLLILLGGFLVLLLAGI
jgi:hypothetical protein